MKRFAAWFSLSVCAGLSSVHCAQGTDLDAPPSASGGAAASEAGVPEGGDTAGTGATGAAGTGAVGSGATGTGAVGTGAVGTGAVGTGAVGTGATGSGAGGTTGGSGGVPPTGGVSGLGGIGGPLNCGGTPTAGSGGSGVPEVWRCDDCKMNGFETDVDCGGKDCGACPLGYRCATDDDCAEGSCDPARKRCLTCDNGQQDPSETGVDCGGICSPCDVGQGCTKLEDCFSRNCVDGVCATSCGCDCATLVPNPSNSGNVTKCNEYLACWALNGCGPGDACTEPSGVCGTNTIGGGSDPLVGATAVIECGDCSGG